MAANHTALRVEPQDLFENQLRNSNTRSVRRASGLVLVGNPEVIRKQAPGNRSDGFRSCLTRFPRV